MSFKWTSCCSRQLNTKAELSSQMEENTENSEYSAVHMALNIELILLRIFSYADFQTLKTCRCVGQLWKMWADFTIHRRDCTRTIITPENLPGMLCLIRKDQNVRPFSFPSFEFVLENIKHSRKSKFWSKLLHFFQSLYPLGSESVQVKSLTIIWPESPIFFFSKPSRRVLKSFLQILQIVSSSLEHLNVTYDLMTRVMKNREVILQLDLPKLKSIRLLPRTSSDVHCGGERRSLSAGSIGLWIIDSCPNLKRVGNFNVEMTAEWVKYLHLVKNYVYYLPTFTYELNYRLLEEFARAMAKSPGFQLESLSDSFYSIQHSIDVQRKRSVETPDPPFFDLFRMAQGSLKQLKVRDFPRFNFTSPSFPPLRNLQKLQFKIRHDLSIQNFLNPNIVDGNYHVDPLPNLHTVTLVLEEGWEGWINEDSNYVVKVVYGSVINLEIVTEHMTLDTAELADFEYPAGWLRALHEFFPNLENVTITSFPRLHHFLPLFLGLVPQFDLRSMCFNVHLGAYANYKTLDSVLMGVVGKPDLISHLLGLRKLDITFEDYQYTAKDLGRPLITVEAFHKFLNALPELRVTFYYDYNLSPKELLSWLRPLADESRVRVNFQHLIREPFARSEEQALLVESTDEPEETDPLLTQVMNAWRPH